MGTWKLSGWRGEKVVVESFCHRDMQVISSDKTLSSSISEKAQQLAILSHGFTRPQALRPDVQQRTSGAATPPAITRARLVNIMVLATFEVLNLRIIHRLTKALFGPMTGWIGWRIVRPQCSI